MAREQRRGSQHPAGQRTLRAGVVGGAGLVRSARVLAAAALRSPARSPCPRRRRPRTTFYLRRTTITVGEDSGYLGYDSDPNSLLGSISTGAKFNYPPFNPPPKHHFDPDYNATVQGLYLSSSGDDDVLTLHIVDDGKNIISLRPGTSRSGSATRASG